MDRDHVLTLDRKYTASEGRTFMTGTQALVRLPLVQRQRDLAGPEDRGGGPEEPACNDPRESGLSYHVRSPGPAHAPRGERDQTRPGQAVL